MAPTLSITGDPAADELLSTDPLALLLWLAVGFSLVEGTVAIAVTIVEASR